MSESTNEAGKLPVLQFLKAQEGALSDSEDKDDMDATDGAGKS